MVVTKIGGDVQPLSTDNSLPLPDRMYEYLRQFGVDEIDEAVAWLEKTVEYKSSEDNGGALSLLIVKEIVKLYIRLDSGDE